MVQVKQETAVLIPLKRLSEDGSEEETEEEDSDYDYSVSINVEEEPVQFSGEAGWGCWLELQIDIEDGEVQCGIAVREQSRYCPGMRCKQRERI